MGNFHSICKVKPPCAQALGGGPLFRLLMKIAGLRSNTRWQRQYFLDVYRSPAVFRTFLENTPDVMQRVLNLHRDEPQRVPSELFHRVLYIQSMNAWRNLDASDVLRNRVRFYGHWPPFWLVIVDNTAFFQPYSFARGNDLCCGTIMPVLKFSKQDSSRTYDFLLDSFKMLWLTSNQGHFQMKGRIAESDHLVNEIFQSRTPWFQDICWNLTNMDSKQNPDRRRHTRGRCEDKKAVLGLIWPAGGLMTPRLSRVLDFSERGLGIELEHGPAPAVSTTLSFGEPLPSLDPISGWYLNEIVRTAQNTFTVCKCDRKNSKIRLALSIR